MPVRKSGPVDISDPFVTCFRCKGRGGGEPPCRTCNGSGNLFRSPKIKAAFKAKEALNGQKYIDDNPWLMSVAFYYGASKNPVALDILERAKVGKVPSRTMIAMVAREINYFLKKRPLIKGRSVKITGEVLSVKSSKTGKTFRMVVRDERMFTVFGRIPKASVDVIQESSRLRFTAKIVNSSGDDNSFGYFSDVSELEILQPYTDRRPEESNET